MVTFLEEVATEIGLSYSMCNVHEVSNYLSGLESYSAIEWLTPNEKKQFARFTQNKRRVEWLSGRKAVKEAIIKYYRSLNTTYDMLDIEILYDGKSAPYIVGHPELDISISHSHEVAIGVVSNCKIGIDLEQIISGHVKPLGKFFFSTNENRMLERCSTFMETKMLATTFWTRKEAVSKLVKQGGALNFNRINTTDDIITVQEVYAKKIRLVSTYSDGYCMSIAVNL